MPIPNFIALLSNALNENRQALALWTTYALTHRLNEQEINQTLCEIEKFSSGNFPQKKYALHLRAIMHQYGIGGVKDEVEAIRLYEQAIKLGNADAMNFLACMHRFGIGGIKNEVEAIRLYEQAIELGNTDAMLNRAIMHQYGIGGVKNEAEAICLYEKAIELGHSFAKNELTALLDKQRTANEQGDTVSHFHQALSNLQKKAMLLKNNGYENAYNSAMEIHTTLVRAHKTLRCDRNLQVFKKTCTDIIEKNRPILDSHRGWSEFLINLAIAIPTLGIGLLIKGGINIAQNKSFFFVHKTKTGKIVDEIQHYLPTTYN